MLAARKKKFQSARRTSRSTELPSEFLIISQPCEYGSVSTRKNWGMMVPAFMVPDNRVSPYVQDPAVNEKRASKRQSIVLRRGSVVFALFRLDVERRPTAAGALHVLMRFPLTTSNRNDHCAKIAKGDSRRATALLITVCC